MDRISRLDDLTGLPKALPSGQVAALASATIAAGVIVGTGHGATTTTDDVLGIAVPMAREFKPGPRPR